MQRIRTYLGRLIGGWISAMILSLVTTLVKRAMAKAAARQGMQTPFQSRTTSTGRATSPPSPSQTTPVKNQPYKQWAVQEAIYQGMRKAELVAAYGQPDTKSTSSADHEIWTYLKDGSNDNEEAAMTVTLDKGVVTDWAEN